ncbi:unnamed protein product [Paramecium pentaurelia]|uniref:MORN repeat protein n=1 Tax=Paramecium pentaurelia TaxID=43138 RepID=A0A8S1UWY8_9CILI|nr:unnamed protein product [Paramecium pentaurelia]
MRQKGLNKLEYHGELVNDEMHEKGKYKWADGNYYYGDWVETLIWGKQILLVDKYNMVNGNLINFNNQNFQQQQSNHLIFKTKSCFT